MKILVVLLLFLGAVLSYGSKSIAAKLLNGKRESNDADSIYVKLVGYALVLIAAIITILK